MLDVVNSNGTLTVPLMGAPKAVSALVYDLVLHRVYMHEVFSPYIWGYDLYKVIVE